MPQHHHQVRLRLDQRSLTSNRFGKIVNQINALEPQLQALSDDELKAQTAKLRGLVDNGAKLDDILPRSLLPPCARHRCGCSGCAISMSS